MENLINIINDTGLKISNTRNYDEYKVFESDNIVNGVCISKYLIVGMTSDVFARIVSQENYPNFEDQILKPVFYDLKGDLGWNFYLIIVLSNSDYETVNKETVIQFEKNDRFARKMVISIDQLKEIIPIGKMVHSDNGETDINPVNEWVDILEKDGMGFCLDDYSNRKFQNYLSGKNVGVDIKKGKVGKTDYVNGSHKIDTINIKDEFRSHCYGKNTDIEIGDVNLLYGPNGSGKTSLLEAIELVVTGNVRKKQKDSSAEVKEDLDSGISLTMKNGITWDIPDKPVTRKKRESIYYQNRVSKHGKDALNTVFHRYNYFSFEDVYMFSFLDEQPEFTEEFSKVIFGEDIKRVEKNIGRYQEEFKKSEKQLKARRDEYRNLIDALSEEVGKNIKYRLNIFDLNEVLKEVLSKFEKCDPNSGLDNVKTWIEKNCDIISQSLVKVELLVSNSEGFDSLYNIRKGISRISKELEQVNTDIERKKRDVNELSKSREFKISQIADMEAKVNSTEAQLNELKKKESEFNCKVLQLDDFSRCKRIQELTEKQNEINYEIDFGNKIQKKWGHLLNVEIKDVVSRAILDSKLIKCASNISDIKNEIRKLDNDIANQERLNSELQVLVSEIQSLGLNYVEKTKNRTCPLCNHKFLSRDDLIEAISKTNSTDGSVLVEMYSRKSTLTEKLNEQISYESNIKASIKITDEIDDADSFISNSIDIVENAEDNTKLNSIKEFFKALKESKVLLENIDDELKLLVDEVYTIDRIESAIEFFNEYLSVKSTGLLEENVLKTKESLNSSVKVLNETHENLSKEIGELKRIKESADRKCVEHSLILKQLISKNEYLLANKNLLEKLLDEVSDVDRSGVIVRENDSWKIVYEKLKKSKEQITTELLKINQLQSKDKKNAELQEIKNKFEIASSELTICRRAIKVIKSLIPSSEYAREFIKSNIEGISNLFSTLHFPKEFEGLGLNENGELVGYRGNGLCKKEVPVYIMSTGQRTAVVLSVFFRFFNSLDTVLEFILLDEPVSNVDDLNTLALFDFLRELSLDKNCQVFFTTANYQVSKLFRRKFSFLRENFHSFRFERNGNSKTSITREHYVEYSNNAIKEEIVF